MKKDELLAKELFNLYAIGKQVIRYFNEIKTSFLSKRVEKIIMQYVEFCKMNKEQVSTTLRNLDINPGNTTNSMVQVITQNLQAMAAQKGYGKEVRRLGYTMSLNRLISYHKANIENLDFWNQGVV
tara:strand:+ start:2090 stop:2467 length:378 start_codon:yes stop_codon:yes gene_type:complete